MFHSEKVRLILISEGTGLSGGDLGSTSDGFSALSALSLLVPASVEEPMKLTQSSDAGPRVLRLGQGREVERRAA